MMEQHRGYWISGSAVPGPHYTSYWESLGMVLKSGRQGSVIEVCPLRDTGATFETREMAECTAWNFPGLWSMNALPQSESRWPRDCPRCNA
jgi:hypothetical protein